VEDSAFTAPEDNKGNKTKCFNESEIKPREKDQNVQTFQAVYEKFHSPRDLPPILSIPSHQMENTLSKLSSHKHKEIADIIFESCKHSVWELYQMYQLHRLKCDDQDPPQTPKLFAVRQRKSSAKGENGQLTFIIEDIFPDGPDAFTLKEWIFKITILCNRKEPNLSFIWKSRNYSYDIEAFALIPSIITPWGALDHLKLEIGLTNAISWCHHLKDWDSLARLKLLWKELHPTKIDEDWEPNLSRSKVIWEKS
jgi:hypothetical protein